MNPLPRWALVTVSGLALALSGCSSSSDSPSPASAASPAASAAAASTATDDSAPGSGSDDVLASRLCTALSKTTADMQMSNASPAAAQAQIAMALAEVYGDDVAKMDGATIETMLKQTCPEVHDEALSTMKLTSFDQM
jgi:hypothetical protein